MARALCSITTAKMTFGENLCLVSYSLAAQFNILFSIFSSPYYILKWPLRSVRKCLNGDTGDRAYFRNTAAILTDANGFKDSQQYILHGCHRAYIMGASDTPILDRPFT